MTEYPEYRGNRPRTTLELEAWHAQTDIATVHDPFMPIVDAHHHIFGSRENAHFYQLQDFRRDIGSGHRVIGTIWVEAYGEGWRQDGPPEMRSVGEVEGITAISRTEIKSNQGACQVAAGMVSNVDLTLGDSVIEVLEAHIEAAAGRLRGIRHHAMYDDGKVGSFVKHSRPRMLSEPMFRRGLACLSRFNLNFDALVYHPQIDEVADLADAFPHQPIILNHIGQVLGVANFAPNRDAIIFEWKSAMKRLSYRSNVSIKVGGMGMPMFGFGFNFNDKPAIAETLAQAWKPYVDFLIETFGPDRCMFESNFPVDKQSCSYAELWNALKLLSQSFSASERRDLFYRSACRTYNLASLLSFGDSIANQS